MAILGGADDSCCSRGIVFFQSLIPASGRALASGRACIAGAGRRASWSGRALAWSLALLLVLSGLAALLLPSDKQPDATLEAPRPATSPVAPTVVEPRRGAPRPSASGASILSDIAKDPFGARDWGDGVLTQTDIDPREYEPPAPSAQESVEPRSAFSSWRRVPLPAALIRLPPPGDNAPGIGRRPAPRPVPD
jgi:hypothetical protein